MKNVIILGVIVVGLMAIAVPAYAMNPNNAQRLEIVAVTGGAWALAMLKSYSKRGDPNAQGALGSYYSEETGYAKAVYWYRKAAAQGNALAETNLGDAYNQGLGVAQDHAKALYWYRKAAAQGDAEADDSLGVMYDKGLGVAQDDVKAVYWFHKAAVQGQR